MVQAPWVTALPCRYHVHNSYFSSQHTPTIIQFISVGTLVGHLCQVFNCFGNGTLILQSMAFIPLEEARVLARVPILASLLYICCPLVHKHTHICSMSSAKRNKLVLQEVNMLWMRASAAPPWTSSRTSWLPSWIHLFIYHGPEGLCVLLLFFD